MQNKNKEVIVAAAAAAAAAPVSSQLHQQINEPMKRSGCAKSKQIL